MHIVNAEVVKAQEEISQMEARLKAQRESLESARVARIAQIEQGMTGLESELTTLRAMGVTNPVRNNSDTPRNTPAAPKGRGQGHKITRAVKLEVRKMVKQRMTGGQIASALGISLPSVQNVKRELGLVKTYHYAQ